MKLKLNGYPVIPDMNEKLAEIIQEAVDNRAKVVEIAYGEAAKERQETHLEFFEQERYP